MTSAFMVHDDAGLDGNVSHMKGDRCAQCEHVSRQPKHVITGTACTELKQKTF